MTYAPRTIAFLCELPHPPIPVDPAPIQKLHNRMFESGAPTYGSFQVAAEGATLSNPAARPGAVSSVAFLADRIIFREELTGLTVDDFSKRVLEVTTNVTSLRNLQIFVGQVVTVRTLINPRNFRDSRTFLKEGTFGFDDEVDEFRREPQLYGFRMVFPPTREEPNAYTLRVESFASDARSLFLENQGTFGPTVVANGLEPLAHNVATTYAFVTERALPFLAHFDVRQEA